MGFVTSRKGGTSRPHAYICDTGIHDTPSKNEERHNVELRVSKGFRDLG